MTMATGFNLPPLAGLCSFEEAQRAELSVERCVSWIKRHHYLLVRLHEMLTARITAEPVYELKMAFSLHAHLCAEHASAYRQRVGEMREPPLGLEAVPHESLKLLCDEVLCSPSHIELVIGIYEVIVPALIESLEQYQATTNLLADAPTVRLNRFCLLELHDLRAYGERAAAAFVDEASRERLEPWVALLDDCLASAGDAFLSPSPRRGGLGRGDDQPATPNFGKNLSTASILNADPVNAAAPLPNPPRRGEGTGEEQPPHPSPLPTTEAAVPEPGRQARRLDIALNPRPSTPAPHFSATPYQYDPVPQRDARFTDSYNAGVNPEAFLYDERFAARDKVLMMLYKRLREIDVPEMMASILSQTKGKPWKYRRDMTRQLWDEARHAMLGEVGFVALGIDWSRIPINFTWSLNLNTQLEPWERHAVLFFIEQGLMPRTGKRFEWEVGQASGLPLAAVIQDFDWADEVLHAQIGREWYVKEFKDIHEAMGYGDTCWTKVLSHWRAYVDQGLTEHRNWWPEIYATACQRWGLTPDPLTLAYCTTYETIRADLADISMSG